MSFSSVRQDDLGKTGRKRVEPQVWLALFSGSPTNSPSHNCRENLGMMLKQSFRGQGNQEGCEDTRVNMQYNIKDLELSLFPDLTGFPSRVWEQG